MHVENSESVTLNRKGPRSRAPSACSARERQGGGSCPHHRGLTGGRYRVRDYYDDRDLGEVSGTHGTVQVTFNDFLVLEAIPV